jgi:hypothetical protein
MKENIMAKKPAVAIEVLEDDEKDGEIPQYEVEDGFRTLVRAHQIRRNPKLMSKIRDHAAKEQKAIDSIASTDDLRKRVNELPDDNT